MTKPTANTKAVEFPVVSYIPTSEVQRVPEKYFSGKLAASALDELKTSELELPIDQVVSDVKIIKSINKLLKSTFTGMNNLLHALNEGLKKGYDASKSVAFEKSDRQLLAAIAEFIGGTNPRGKLSLLKDYTHLINKALIILEVVEIRKQLRTLSKAVTEAISKLPDEIAEEVSEYIVEEQEEKEADDLSRELRGGIVDSVVRLFAQQGLLPKDILSLDDLTHGIRRELKAQVVDDNPDPHKFW